MNLFKLTLLITTLSIPLNATILSTAQVGNAPAHCLIKGDAVKSLAKDKLTIKEARVIAHAESTTDSIVEIDLGDRTIQATQNQTLFDPVFNKWIKAKDLSNNSHLLGDDMLPKVVRGVTVKKGSFSTMKVSVDGSHYMFVDGVLTHNFLFVPAVVGFFGYMIFGRKKNGKIIIDVGGGHNGSIVREHGRK